eukprot:scaffold41022_cov139-Skeletonema_dohrnii-CCMP3373.AAC.1
MNGVTMNGVATHGESQKKSGAHVLTYLPSQPMHPHCLRHTPPQNLRETLYPTQDPTRSPSMEPTLNPTPRPTRQPTPFPTRRPTRTPRPTSQPTSSPTKAPTSPPTKVPTSSPTKKGPPPATKAPSSSPSQIPSSQPSLQPSTSKQPSPGPKAPSSSPSQIPSSQPSLQPSTSSQPSSSPSADPSQVPSSQPSLQPSSQPSLSPSVSHMPSSQPSLQPSSEPSSSPSASQMPSSQPSLQPSTSSQPSANPSQIPSSQPSNKPSPALTVTITAVAPLVPHDDILGDFQFGTSVAISGTSALIGAPNPDDNSGVANLFNSSLTDTAIKLPAPAPTPTGSYAECGASVALSNDYAVIGCPGFTKSSEGNKIGAVLIYTRVSLDDPPREIIYEGSDAAEFGTSVSVNAAGILAVGSNKGSVELFNLSNTPPSPIPITSTLGNDFDTTSVALNDNVPPLLAVGAIKEAEDRSGSVFLYTDVLNPNAVPVEISAPTAAKCGSGCLFGFSVALFDRTLVVGSPGPENLEGMAFVYDLTGDLTGDFEPPQSLLPASPLPARSFFGSSVAITNNGAVVVGSSSDSENVPGAAFFFNKNEDGNWYAPDFEGDQSNPIVGGSHQEQFGGSVAISDTAFVVGAPFFESSKGKAVAHSYEPATNP